MDNVLKKKLRAEIQVYLRKFPGAGTKTMKQMLKKGSQIIDLDRVKPNTLNRFMRLNISKFLKKGDCEVRAKGQGRKKSKVTHRNIQSLQKYGETKGSKY